LLGGGPADLPPQRRPPCRGARTLASSRRAPLGLVPRRDGQGRGGRAREAGGERARAAPAVRRDADAAVLASAPRRADPADRDLDRPGGEGQLAAPERPPHAGAKAPEPRPGLFLPWVRTKGRVRWERRRSSSSTTSARSATWCALTSSTRGMRCSSRTRANGLWRPSSVPIRTWLCWI